MGRMDIHGQSSPGECNSKDGIVQRLAHYCSYV